MRQALLQGQHRSASQLCPLRSRASGRPSRATVRVHNAAQPTQRWPASPCFLGTILALLLYMVKMLIKYCLGGSSSCTLLYTLIFFVVRTSNQGFSCNICDISLHVASSRCRGSSGGRKRDVSADALAGYSKGIKIDTKQQGIGGLPTDRYSQQFSHLSLFQGSVAHLLLLLKRKSSCQRYFCFAGTPRTTEHSGRPK